MFIGTADTVTQGQENLLQRAVEAMEKAYAPYSGFHVGAALETVDGKIYLGCNVENSSYGATNCAERTAIFKAISEGDRAFARIAIVGGHQGDWKEYAAPCGICRQVMSEFAGPDFEIILGKKDGERKVGTLREFLPESFVL